MLETHREVVQILTSVILTEHQRAAVEERDTKRELNKWAPTRESHPIAQHNSSEIADLVVGLAVDPVYILRCCAT